ncbi:MAG: GNAT family N-acetyltransferase [Tepidisphaera sp.]
MHLSKLTEADRPAIHRIIRLAFAGTAEGVTDWMKHGGDANFRLVRDGERVAATLLHVPMGLYVGGRSVSMQGVAGVGVAPENRGQGYAKKLMRGFVQDAAEDGFALAGLYASTHTLYRGVGFEHAAHRFQYAVPLVQIDITDDTGPLHAITDEDDHRVKQCYAEFASRFTGTLDRGPYVWGRVRKFREMEYLGYAVANASGGFDGYVMLHQGRRPDGRQDITLSDFVFTTPQAGRRLWGFLADFRMMGEDLVFFGGPTHPALTMLRQQRYSAHLKDSALIRILSVKHALESRGYPAGLSATLHLDVTDDLIPANQGRWTLEVQNGKAAVTPGGPGTVATTIRGLAMLYTGYATPQQAALMGEVRGSGPDLAAAAHLFSQGTPWMVDMF